MDLFDWIIALLIVCYVMISFGTTTVTQDINITVEEKIPRTPYQIVDTKYNVYIIEDNWALGAVDGGNIYAKLQENGTYSVKVSGIRFPPLSWFQNIVKINT